MLTITSPKPGETVRIQSTVQQQFLDSDRTKVKDASSYAWLSLEFKTQRDRSLGAGLTVTWEPCCEATLEISEDEGFSSPLTLSGKGECFVTVLKLATRYFARVRTATECSETVSFTTEDRAPRFLTVEGATNVRDCGGWKTKDGRRVRQGLFYRGSEIGGRINATEEGLRTLREQLGIRAVLDLRGPTAQPKDPLGADYYLNVPFSAYHNGIYILPTMHDVFKFLADKRHYPMYFHCMGGADRTGTIAFLVNALLGVSETDLADDFELTTLSLFGVRSRNSQSYLGLLSAIAAYDGETLSEKVENYLLAAGITEEEIATIREIFLED
ncbi:MAG: tyrosine-protein phosphatase [Clostridia bacterium]|nr:tyrosine-protein phosphatase [Clostridia bacterium]